MEPGFYWARWKRDWNDPYNKWRVVNVANSPTLGPHVKMFDELWAVRIYDCEFGPRIPDYEPEEETEK